MPKLPMTLACWDYDRTRAIADGTVQPDGIALNYLSLPVEETFFRMARFQEFDACEMSLSSYCVTLMQDDPPFIAIPVYPRSSICRDRIAANSSANPSRRCACLFTSEINLL